VRRRQTMIEEIAAEAEVTADYRAGRRSMRA
jgi:hypothetical protein